MEIIVNGVKTNYLSYGEGKPLLILHGWGSCSDRWIKEAEIISATLRPGSGQEGFKVIVPDLPGFGASDKLSGPWRTNDYIKWFEEFIKQLGIENFYLLGYSFGGALAVKMAVKYPQRVEKLFLVSAAIIREKTAKKDVAKKVSKVVKIFKFVPFYKFFRKAVYKFIIRKSDYVYTEGVMKETYLNVISDDVSFNLPFIKVPTVIIWGDKDQSTPVEDAYTAKKKIKNSKLVIIPGADHLMHKQLPELLAEKILENL